MTISLAASENKTSSLLRRPSRSTALRQLFTNQRQPPRTQSAATATSFCRDAPRATMMLATLRQPISTCTEQRTSGSAALFHPCAGSSLSVLALLWLPARSGSGMLPVLHRLHLAQGVRQAYLRPQAGHYTALVPVMVLHFRRWHPRRKGNPHLNLRIGIGNHLGTPPPRRLPVQMDLPADYCPITAKPALEDAPCEHHGVPVRMILRFGKGSAEGRLDAEQGKRFHFPRALLPGREIHRVPRELNRDSARPPCPQTRGSAHASRGSWPEQRRCSRSPSY